MKNIFLSAAVTVSLAASAVAADLPVKAPVYQAYNWSGCYVGAQAGSVWGRTGYTDTQNLTGTGFDLAGGIGGGHLGCNYQVTSFVIGIEGDAEWTSLRGDDGGFNFTLDRVEGRWQGSIRGRAGFVFDRVLVYGTGGWSALNVEYSVSNPIITTEAVRRTLSGWTVGGGIEYALAPSFTGRLEYRYASYGSELFPFQQVATRRLNETTTSTARVGLSYKLGGL